MSGTRAVLTKEYLPALAAFARSNVLLAFDYDGTLAPIASSPDKVHMRATTRRLLLHLARRYPCAVISGRALADVGGRMHRFPLRCVFGNHGLEPIVNGSSAAALTREWVAVLKERLPQERGLIIEDKTYTLTVHYRAARHHDRVRAAVLAAVQDLHDARIIDGLEAVNVLPKGGANKGVALRRALQSTGCDRAIYVGDDATDEDALAALDDQQLLGIRVGPSDTSAARYHIDSQLEIDALLTTLLELRPALSESRPVPGEQEETRWSGRQR